MSIRSISVKIIVNSRIKKYISVIKIKTYIYLIVHKNKGMLDLCMMIKSFKITRKCIYSCVKKYPINMTLPVTLIIQLVCNILICRYVKKHKYPHSINEL